MRHFLFRNIQLLQVLIIVTALLVSMTTVSYARGYGSGGGEGQNYTDYIDISMAERRSFAKYDSDNNGFLSINEAVAMGISDELFRRLDIDQNGRLNRAEFIKIREIEQKAD